MSHLEGVAILGAGGHGREVAEILRFQGGLAPGTELLGFIDENPEMRGQERDGLPVLGDWTWFDRVDPRHVSVICATGAPSASMRLAARATELGLTFVSAISSRAYISPLARLGRGVTVFPNVTIHTGASIGDHSILNAGVTVSHDAVIGAFCNINPGVHVAGSVTIRDGCYVGMGSNIIQGLSIGPETVVGAGAVVVRDLGDRVVAVGVPARAIKKM